MNTLIVTAVKSALRDGVDLRANNKEFFKKYGFTVSYSRPDRSFEIVQFISGDVYVVNGYY